MKSSHNVVLGVGIMAVPERRARVETLCARLGVSEAAVAWDTGHTGHVPNWWRAVALASAAPATHALILEDDAEPCQDFLSAVIAVAARYPERVISFFAARTVPLPITSKLTLEPHHGFGDVAVVYPVLWLQALRRDFMRCEKELQRTAWQVGYGADEMRRKLRPQDAVWSTHPSLVQHGCPRESTLGHVFTRSVALPCLDMHTSAFTLDWSAL